MKYIVAIAETVKLFLVSGIEASFMGKIFIDIDSSLDEKWTSHKLNALDNETFLCPVPADGRVY